MNVKRSLLSLVLSVVMIFTMMPLAAGPAYADAAETGSLGKNVTYTLENGALTITGTGAMAPYYTNSKEGDEDESPFYRKTVTSVSIGEGITTIANNLLYGQKNITSVSFPSTLEGIGAGAFAKTRITSLDFSNTPNLKHIGAEAFYQCSRYSGDLVLPDSLTSLGENAFSMCYYQVSGGSGNQGVYTGIESVTIPGGIKTLPNACFRQNYALKTVTIKDGVTSLGSNAFINCVNLHTVNLPDSVTDLGTRTFSSTGLININIPAGVTEFGNYLFDVTPFTTFDIPETVRSIQKYAFANSGLTEIVVPDSVTYIGESAFTQSYDLTTVVLPKSCTMYTFNTFALCRKLTSATLPENLGEIGGSMFHGCSALETITIPETVTSIGRYAFASCKSLKSITIPGNVTSIGEQAFANCDSLESITIPASVKKIDGHAFYNCPALTEITVLSMDCEIAEGAIPEGVTIKCYEGSTAQAYAEARGQTVEPMKKDTGAEGSGAVNISAAAVSGVKAKTYTGKALTQDPVVKYKGAVLKKGTDYTLTFSNNIKVGKATMTIRGINGYTGVVTRTYKIVPKGTSIKKLKARKKGMTVKWKKRKLKMNKARITGYQIQIAKNKKFTKGKKTYTVKGYRKVTRKIKKLKGKKRYYVRVRTYKKIGGEKYCSNWSKVKSVKTK